MKEKYFFINSNICFPGDDLNFDKFMYDISGNTGNSYITYSIIKLLYGKFQKVDSIRNLWFYQSNQKDIDRINNEYSKVILVLQDNLRLHDSYLAHDIYTGLADFFKKIKIPVVVFSLGSNSFNNDWGTLHSRVNKGLIELLKVISDKTVYFGVRGEYTLEVLNNLKITNAEAIGCPSYFETGRDRIIKKPDLKSDFKILSGGHFENLKTKDVHYVLQDEKLFIKSAAFPSERLLPEDFKSVDSDSEYQNIVLKAYLENKIAVFSDMEQWRKFDKGFDFYVGTRVHGAIMASNAGLPVMVTSLDSRSEEMCSLFGLSRRLDFNKNTDPREIYESIDVDKVNSRYNSLYDNFSEWLKKNDMQISTTKDFSDTSVEEDVNSVICLGEYKINHEIARSYIENAAYKKEASAVEETLINPVISKTPTKLAKYVAKLISYFVIGSKNRKKARKWVLEKLNK
jgi:hypothetical protein